MEESVDSEEQLEVDTSDVANNDNNDNNNDNNNGLEVNSEPANNSSILEVNLEEGSAENQQGTLKLYFNQGFIYLQYIVFVLFFAFCRQCIIYQ